MPKSPKSEVSEVDRTVTALRQLMDELAVGLTAAKKLGIRANFNYADAPDQPFKVEAKFWKDL